MKTLFCAILWVGIVPLSQQGQGTLVIEARSGTAAVSKVEISADGQSSVGNESGEATLQLPVGNATVTVQRFGFASKTVQASITDGATTRLVVEMEPEVSRTEEITVTATRNEQRIEDVPLRVEVLDTEEIEEKALMTPGDIAMLLNETGGLRVQVTSPALGAATSP